MGLIDNEGKEYCACDYLECGDIDDFPDIPKDVICILYDNSPETKHSWPAVSGGKGTFPQHFPSETLSQS